MANPKKELYQVHTTWSVDATVEVEAWSRDDAIEKVMNMDDLPDNGSYVDDSFDAYQADPVRIQDERIADGRKLAESILRKVEIQPSGDAIEKRGEIAGYPDPTTRSWTASDILEDWGFRDAPDSLGRAVEDMLKAADVEKKEEDAKSASI